VNLPAQAMACMVSGLQPINMTQGSNLNGRDGALLAEMANEIIGMLIDCLVTDCLSNLYKTLDV